MRNLVTLLTAALEGDRLNCDTINTSSVDFDWSEGWTETWDTIQPDFREATVSECAEWLSDRSDVPSVTYDVTVDDVEYAITRTGDRFTVEPAYKGTSEWTDDEPAGFPSEFTEAIDDGEDDYRDTLAAACEERLSDRRGDEEAGLVPMMSCYYPLPGYSGDEGADQLKLANLPLPLCLARVNGEVVLALTGGGMDLTWEICQAFVVLGFRPPVTFCRPPRMSGWENEPDKFLTLKLCRESARIAAMWANRAVEEADKMIAEAEAVRAAKAGV